MSLSQRLGLSANKKLLIIHADDAGLSHSQNRATIRGLEQGAINSYSIMVPCPWFYEMAEYAKNHLEFDHGIHLSLTCEWENYKFGPLMGAKEVPSLVDKNGYFYRDRNLFAQNAKLEDIGKEIRAQIDRALSFGLQPSHIDSHMYSVGINDEVLGLYKEIAKEYKLPAFLNHDLINVISGKKQESKRDESNIYVDQVFLGNYDQFVSGRLAAFYKTSLQSLSKGLNLVLIHPAFDDDEMKAITKNHPNFGSSWRQIDLNYFISNDCKSELDQADIHLITWRDIKKLMYT